MKKKWCKQGVDELLDRDSLGEIVLVAEDKQRDAGKGRLREQLVELLLGELELLLVCRVDDIDDRVHAAAVALPHAAETRLAADVPHLDRHVALRDLLHIEAHCRDHVLLERPALCVVPLLAPWCVCVIVGCVALWTNREDVDESRLAAVLETDERQLHFLLPEEALEPVDDTVPPPHDRCHCCQCSVCLY